jgi:hypothetical protein
VEYNGYKPGFIYVLKSAPYYKIGFADDVEQRLKTVGTSAKPDDLAEPISLLFKFPTRSKMVAERDLHEFLRSARAKGEWFKLNERSVELLRRFADGESVDEFIARLHRIPEDFTLFTQGDVQFCKDFGIRFILPNDKDKEILPDGLEAYIEDARALAGRQQRAKRYQKMLTGMLEHMSVDDMEWLMEAVMARGVSPEGD